MSQRVRSDVELMARTRIIGASLLIYLLVMAFWVLADRLYGQGSGSIYARLAVVPFAALLLLRWLRLVRVHPPLKLVQARRLMARARFETARDLLEQLLQEEADHRRLDRARRVLQGGLAIPLADELKLEIGRCSLELGQLERAAVELTKAQQRLPARADVAIDLARQQQSAGEEAAARETLQRARRYMDAFDRQTVIEDPELLELMGEAPSGRSAFWPRIQLERAAVLALSVVAVIHALHFYLGLF